MKINETLAKEYPWGREPWLRRTKIIGKMIPEGASVLDLGGGLGHLFAELKEPRHYRSMDIEKWNDLTIVADFNEGEYPETGRTFQYIVAQGILEYISKPADFLKNIKKYGDILILTYRRYVPGEWRVERKEYTYADVNEALARTGWERIMETSLGDDGNGPIEKIMLCRKKEKN